MRSFWPWALLMLCLAAGPGRAADVELQIDTVAEGLAFPWSLAFLPDGRALVTERAGRLRVIVDGKLDDRAIGGVPKAFVEGQGGLFEVLPDPDFASNQLIYLSLAQGRSRANRTQVVRARLDGLE
ncbi:MAG: PQQ-dependent sugar dehydrogenase, partial [Xanthomonadales bacterium]|nr:PQQ-dependent sugar dehydrogenase [Xanthomonadales bacterium]